MVKLRVKYLLDFGKKFFKGAVSFFRKYSDDILKVFGAGAFVALVVKLIKDFMNENEQATGDLQPLLEKLEKSKAGDLDMSIDEETYAELDKICAKYPKFESRLRGLLEKKMDEIIEEKHEESEEMETVSLAVIPFTKEYMKADDEKVDRIKKDLAVGIFGVRSTYADEDGDEYSILTWLDPSNEVFDDDPANRNSLIAVQNFLKKYTDFEDESVGCDENDYPLEDDMNDSGILIGDSGVTINFANPYTEVTDELRKDLEDLRKALGILVAENPDEKNVADKYFREYFLDC